MFGGGCDIAYVFWAMEILIDFFIRIVQFVGEILQVLGDIAPCLVALHVVLVEIPIELGLSFFLQGSKELLFYFL